MHRYGATFAAVACVSYAAIFLAGLVGNFLVAAAIARDRRLRTVANLFLADVALADALLVVFGVPTSYSNVTNEWPLGWFLCKFSSFFANASVAASINSLLAVAVDRLLAICFPSKPQLTKKAAAAAIAVIWLSSLCVSLPWLIYSETFESEGGSTHCIDAWPSTETKWTIFLLGPVVFGYFIPSFLISLCCLFIWMEDSWGRIPTEAGDATASKFRRGQEEVLAVKMLVEVTVVFLISWAPRFGLEVVIGFQETFFWENEDVGIYAILFADCLGLSASFVKPILYAFRDEKLRDGVLAVLRSRCCY